MRTRKETPMKLNSSICAVVTGGASGLGRATSQALADKGVKVAVFDLNTDAGEAFARDIGGVFFPVDVTSSPDGAASFAPARPSHRQERVLLHCPGISRALQNPRRHTA